jgi:hypothetical protein
VTEQLKQQFKAQGYMVAGCNIRSARPRPPIAGAAWFVVEQARDDDAPSHMEPRIARKLFQNWDVLGALEQVQQQACFGAAVLLWVEDDVSACPDASRHLGFIARWLRTARARGGAREVVFARTSFGFNGWMARCSALPRIISRLRQNVCVPGLDDELYRYFASQSVVYQHNLFSHDESIASTIEGAELSSNRRVFLPGCFATNIQPLAGNGFDVPACAGLAFCSTGANKIRFQTLLPPELRASAATHAAKASSETSSLLRPYRPDSDRPVHVVVANDIDSCTHACESEAPGMRCDLDAMRAVNTVAFAQQRLSFYCRSIRWSLSVGNDQPVVDWQSGQCMLRQDVDTPTAAWCDFSGTRLASQGRPVTWSRICGCVEGEDAAELEDEQ